MSATDQEEAGQCAETTGPDGVRRRGARAGNHHRGDHGHRCAGERVPYL